LLLVLLLLLLLLLHGIASNAIGSGGDGGIQDWNGGRGGSRDPRGYR
jgi:hypothetical protein